MCTVTIGAEIATTLAELEVDNHDAVRSRDVFEKRKAALKRLLGLLDKDYVGLPRELHEQLKMRIQHSLNIMEIADAYGVIQ